MDVEGCSLPDDLLYDLENSIWVRTETDGTWTVGVLASLAAFAGPMVSVRFRPIPGIARKGESLGTVESVRFTGPVRSPAESSVVDRNDQLRLRPRLLNDAPYAAGWFARLRPTDPVGAARGLESASRVVERLRQRILYLRIHCYPATPDVTMYEIGIECSAILAKLTEEVQRRAPGEVVLLVTDDPTSPIEMVRWSDQTGHSVLHHRVEGNLHHFLVRREGSPEPRRRPWTGA